MKRGYLKTYIKTLFIIVMIVAIIAGIIYFMKNGYDDEQFETVKTNMLLIEGKTKVVAEKVRIQEKDASYVGKKIEEMTDNIEIKDLQEKEIIDLGSEENNYYVLEKENLEQLGLTTIELNEGFYIVEYNSNEIIYSKGAKDSNGNIVYKLSEFIK